MRRLRVLHVYKEYYPVLGGIENHVRDLCRALQERDDFEPAVLVTNQSARTVRETIDGIPVIRAGRIATVSRNPLSISLVREVARHPADIIHLHFPFPTGEMAYLLAGRGRKMVLTYHSDIVKQQMLLRFYGPFMRVALGRASRILATSPNYVQSSPYLPAYANKISVVPLGIDGARFAHPDEAAVAAIRRRYGGPLVLFVGVLRYYKGLAYLIDAMPEIDAHLVIVGTGPMDGELRAQIASRRIEDKVKLAGEVPDVELPAYYHACDVFVLPSSQRSEALGLSQMEAMACGKPVVCTELGTGTSYVNRNGETGLVVPPMDPEALSRAVARLLADAPLRERLGRRAAERVREEFAQERMVERIVQVYREVAAEN
ncbi:MAG: glycosyltransferase [Chloroflexi bacterium]|nr:glycosyltransferase [Chloroflexota bacterium]